MGAASCVYGPLHVANISLHVSVTAVLAFVMVNSGNIGHQSLIDISGRMFVFTSARAEGGGWVVGEGLSKYGYLMQNSAATFRVLS